MTNSPNVALGFDLRPHQKKGTGFLYVVWLE